MALGRAVAVEVAREVGVVGLARRCAGAEGDERLAGGFSSICFRLAG